MKTIYLDYASTTPVSDLVFDAMTACLKLNGNFANPNSQHHALGLQACDAVEKSRYEIVSLIGCEAKELIFVSGATEANNLAIKGAAYALKEKGRHIVTVATEHKSVLSVCHQLENEGFNITYLLPTAEGLVTEEMIENVLTDGTILVSVMHVNNELGTIQNIQAIGKLLEKKGIAFHVDAAQSAGKLPIRLSELSIALMSFSAHKIYGPKGIGALYINTENNFSIKPLMVGGGQENNLRSGTLATHQIVGMGKAFAEASLRITSDYQEIKKLNHYFLEELKKIPNVVINNTIEKSIPHIVNFQIVGMDSSEILNYMPEVALAVGSACSANSHSGSHVLKAIGLSGKQAKSSIRASLGRFTTTADLDFSIDRLKKIIKALENKKQ